MGVHVPWKIAILVSSLIVLVITVAVSLAYITNDRNDVMHDKLGRLSGQAVPNPGKYGWLDPKSGWSEYGPLLTKTLHPGWLAATMYVAIWLLTAAWLVYSQFTLCKHSSPTTYLYDEPEYLPWWIYVGTMAMLILTCLYIYVTSWVQLWQALLVLLVEVVIGAVILCLALRALERSAAHLKLAGKAAEIGWTIALVHNGVGFYTTWLLISFHQNLGIVLVYNLDLNMDTACIIVLCVALAFLVVLFVMENFVSYQRLKYIYSTWICIIITFVAILTFQFDKDDGIHIFLMILLFLSILALFFKFGCFWCRNQEKQEEKGKGGVVFEQSPHIVTTIPSVIAMPHTINKAPATVTITKPDPLPQTTYVGHTHTNPTVINQCAPTNPTVITQCAHTNPTVITQCAPSNPTVINQCAQTNPTVITQCAPTNPTVINQCAPTNPTVINQCAPTNPTIINQCAPTNPTFITQHSAPTMTHQCMPGCSHPPGCDPLTVTNHYHITPSQGQQQVVVGSGGFFNFS